MLNLRPNHNTHRNNFAKRLSRQTQASQILRCGNRQDLCIFNKQFQTPCFDDSPTVSQSLAGGIVFQMDQTKSQSKNLLWYIRKRCEDPNLDCDLGICSCRYNEKATPSQGESLHNFTGAERFNFRKNTNLSTNYRIEMQKRTNSYL